MNRQTLQYVIGLMSFLILIISALLRFPSVSVNVCTKNYSFDYLTIQNPMHISTMIINSVHSFSVSTSAAFQLRFSIHRHIQASFVLPSHLPYLTCLFKLAISSNLSQLGFKSRFFSLLHKQKNSIQFPVLCATSGTVERTTANLTKAAEKNC